MSGPGEGALHSAAEVYHVVKRVLYTELEHDDNDLHDLGGEPFTGVAYTLHPGAGVEAEVE